ncbi:hypothetical protein HDV05_006345 [Chytridiales sp. JEL 0842]|nr:hypothetical protein HDV05_006345 [Chytridiales sp. JEL 0842]
MLKKPHDKIDLQLIINDQRSAEEKELNSEINKKRYKNLPQEKKDDLAVEIKKRWENPLYRASLSAKQKERWKDEVYAEAMTAMLRLRALDEEFRAKLSAARTLLWINPLYREKMMVVLKLRWQHPEFRDKMVEAMKLRWQHPEFRDKMHDVLSTSMKARWADEANRLRTSLKMAAAAIIRLQQLRNELSDIEATQYEELVQLSELERQKAIIDGYVELDIFQALDAFFAASPEGPGRFVYDFEIQNYPHDDAFAFANILRDLALGPGQIVNYSAKLAIENMTPMNSLFNAKPMDDLCGSGNNNAAFCHFGQFKANLSAKTVRGTFAFVADMGGRSSGESVLVSLLCGAASKSISDRTEEVIARACGLLKFFRDHSGRRIDAKNSLLRFWYKPNVLNMVGYRKRILGDWPIYRLPETQEYVEKEWRVYKK